MRASAFALGLAGALAPGLSATEPNAAKDGKTIRIGLIESLFRDVPQPMIMAASQPFRSLMEAQTGLTGELLPGGDAAKLGDLLAKGKVHLGVFHGFEFAWAQQKHPKLRPLVIAINQTQHLVAHVMVRQDSAATGLADLKGKKLALPSYTREHCRLYLERHCQAKGQELKQYFAEITTPASMEDALDDLVDGTVDVVIADGVSLGCFKRRKPVRFGKLKELEKSALFPAAVVAYREGVLSEDNLRRFREGMVSANQNVRGRQLLTMWKLTGFEAIPSDYTETLANIAKLYPPPSSMTGKTDAKAGVSSSD